MRILILIFAVSISGALNAQMGKPFFDGQTLLFPSFEAGNVLLKNGTTEQALMNFDTDKQNLIFVQNDQYMVLTALETVDTIYIQNRKFIPVGNTICEMVGNSGDWSLLANYTVKRQPLTATTDKSGTSKKSTSEVSNTVTNVYVGRNYRENSNFQVIPRYYFKYKGKLYKAAARKQLLKSLGPKYNVILEPYLDKHPVSFEKAEDMLDILELIAQAK